MHQFQNKIIVITAPSGSGKTTLVKRLLKACPQLAFSVSACTRSPRPGEVHGKDYYFFSEEDFKLLISENAFVEHEMVYTGKYYGTLKSELDRIWYIQKCPVIDIDVHGAKSLITTFPAPQVCSIFIKAPSVEELKRRLQFRGTETAQSLQERITKAEHELTFAPYFKHIVVNEILEDAAQQLLAIVTQFLAE
ncbi:MAG: guanylate kinase [Chitinophagia bacterium]|nr:guanylate kinase [Chitinophagia bacterium]